MSSPRPHALRTPIIAIAAAAICLALDFTLEQILPDSSLRQLLSFAACNVLVALSLNVINGMAGQFSIGHAGFVGLGAYVSAVLASHLHHAFGGGEPSFARSFVVVPCCVVASAIVAGAFGFVVGLPSLRLKGDYLAIVTLGFAEIVRLTIGTASTSTGETSAIAWSKVGPDGYAGPFLHYISVLISSLGGQNGYQGLKGEGVPLYAGPFWIFGITGVLGVLAWRLKFSGWGRALRALREDEIAAAAVGVDPTRYKVTSFVLAAVGAGIAGGLMAIMRDGAPSVQPETYNFQASFDAITMVILGGSGSVSGAILGGLFVTFSIKAIEFAQGASPIQSLRQSLPWLDLNALRMIVYAAVLIGLMILRPEGLLGERELFQKRPANKPPANKPPNDAPNDAPYHPLQPSESLAQTEMGTDLSASTEAARLTESS
jgi:branched-chain amino acid transport system permease protein